MTQIKLKKNNEPKKPGFYLLKCPQDFRPYVAELRQEDKGLLLLYGISIFPLSKLEKGALWSDEIVFYETRSLE